MGLGDIIEAEDVVADLRAPDKRRLIDEVARLAARLAGADAAAVAEALNARERLGSTGMGSGIALPHARLATVTRPRGFFARLRQPVDFDAIDGERVDLVFLLLLPAQSLVQAPALAQAQGDHLNALAAVARRLRDDRVRAALRRAREPGELHAILVGDGTG